MKVFSSRTYDMVTWWFLTLPVILFCVSWYKPLLGLPLAAALICAAVQYSRDISLAETDIKAGTASSRTRTLCIALTLAWAAVTAELAVSSYFWDWPKHRALFLDLCRCQWPVHYNIDNKEYILSYYLAYYLLPALLSFGHMFLLNLLVMGWTMLGFGLIGLGYFSRCRTLWEWLALLMLLLAFNGWDIAGWLWHFGEWPSIGAHLPGWNPFQVSANIMALLWVPQHVLPAWLGCMLFLRMNEQQKFRYGGLLIATAIYWSALVAVGMALFVGLHYGRAITQQRYRLLIHRYNALAAAIAVPCLYYFARDFSLLPHGWSWNYLSNFTSSYTLFALCMVTVMVGLVIVLAPRQLSNSHLFPITIVLLLAPVYRVGEWFDLTMRLPMCFYFYLLWVAGDGMLAALRGLKEKTTRRGARRRLMLATVIMVPALLSSVSDIISAGETLAEPVHYDMGLIAIAPYLGNLSFQYISPADRLNFLMRNATLCQ